VKERRYRNSPGSRGVEDQHVNTRPFVKISLFHIAMVKKIKHVLVCIKKGQKISFFFYLKKVDSDLLNKRYYSFFNFFKKTKNPNPWIKCIWALFTRFYWDILSERTWTLVYKLILFVEQILKNETKAKGRSIKCFRISFTFDFNNGIIDTLSWIRSFQQDQWLTEWMNPTWNIAINKCFLSI